MADRILPQDFYVYAHRKASTNEIFYIGKGRGNRAWRINGRGKCWANIVKKHGLKIDILVDGLQEWAAFEFEREFISLYGRKDMGYGKLINLTCGGEGVTGLVASEQTKKRMSEAQKGTKKTQQHRLAMSVSRRGKPLSEKNKKGLSKAKKGKNLTELHKNALKNAWENVELKKNRVSLIRKSCAVSVLCIEKNLTFSCIADAYSWLRANGHFITARSSSITSACRGNLKTAYGYTWSYV